MRHSLSAVPRDGSAQPARSSSDRMAGKRITSLPSMVGSWPSQLQACQGRDTLLRWAMFLAVTGVLKPALGLCRTSRNDCRSENGTRSATQPWRAQPWPETLLRYPRHKNPPGGCPASQLQNCHVASAGTDAEHDHAHSRREDAQVEQQAPVGDVAEVVVELDAGVLDRGAIGIAHLRQAGEAGEYGCRARRSAG